MTRRILITFTVILGLGLLVALAVIPSEPVHAGMVCLNSDICGSGASATATPTPTATASPASVTLNNLGTTSINAPLLFQTGQGIGSTTSPVKNIVMNLSGTYGTGSYTFAGTPNGNYTATFPGNLNFTMAGQDIANTFTSASGNTVSANSFFNFVQDAPLLFGVDTSAAYDRITETSVSTPDGLQLRLGSASNSLNVIETADGAFDFNNGSAGTSAQTDPAIIIHSHNQSTAQWVELRHNAVNAVIATGTGGLILPGAIHTAGTVPAVSNTSANSCGTTTATITGTDTTGKVVVGATSGTSCTLTFNVAAPTRRQCWCNNETTANLCRTVYTDTTHSNLVGVFVAGDSVAYGCLNY